MNKFILLLVTLIAFSSDFGAAFTVVPTSIVKTTMMNTNRAEISPFVPQRSSNTSLNMFVDFGVTFPPEQAIGSVIMLVAFVSFWEVITPGRAKKV